MPELPSSSVLSCSLASLMVREWMGEDSYMLDISWRADAKPLRLLRGVLVPLCLFSSVFAILSDLGFWVCGDAGLWRFGSPLYVSSFACSKQYAAKSRLGLSGPHCYTIILVTSSIPDLRVFTPDFLQVSASNRRGWHPLAKRQYCGRR